MHKYGSIQIKLKQLMEKEGVSKNKLGHWAELQHSQMTGYYNNSITRLDIDVLARICTALHCKIEDLLEFIPADDSEPEINPD